MKYYLVIKKAHNNYLPIDIEKLINLPDYKLTTIEGIDSFTINYEDEMALKDYLLSVNFIDEEESSKDLEIIYYENGGIRQLEYGPIFKKHLEVFDSEFLISFLIKLTDNPLATNRIFNAFSKQKNKSDIFQIVLDVLKNVKRSKDENKIKNIYYLRFLPYEEKRQLTLFIYNSFYDMINLNKMGIEGEINERSRVKKNQ